jgi:hypothetical protein
MPTTPYKPIRRKKKEPRRPIKSPLTKIQKLREMTMTIFDVDKTDIADAMDVSRGLISNAFTDRHRSPTVERAVVAYLNQRLDTLPRWEYEQLQSLGVLRGRPNGRDWITVESLGWPEPGGA